MVSRRIRPSDERTPRWFGWTLLAVAAVPLILSVPLQLTDADEALFAMLGIAIVALPVSIAVSLFLRRLGPLLVAVVYLATSCIAFTDFKALYPLREDIRWLTSSAGYKAAVLESAKSPGELRHAAWDSWGFLDSTFVYLVFDPDDTLLAASRSQAPGKVAGIPCAPFRVHRMEQHWYSVQYFTGETWSFCGS